MLPLGMLGLLMLSLPLCDAGNSCPPTLNPLIGLDPPVIEFGKHVSVNCSTEEDVEEITLMLGNKPTTNDGLDNEVSSVAMMTDWDMKSECKIKLNDSFECSKEIDIILYQIPEVSLLIQETETLDEETNYKLQCDVFNAAPAQNLTVKWYKSDEIINGEDFSETTKTPVNKSSTLTVSVTRDESVVRIRCEAQLELGPHGPQHPVVSQTHNLSALYAPEFRTNQSNHVVVNVGDDVSLTCEADGNPSPKYQWTINGKDTLENLDTLNIIKVNKSAKYSCTASNKYGHVTQNISVHVPEVTAAAPAATPPPQALMPQDAPEFRTNQSNHVVVNVGDDVSLTCEADGNPPPKYQWTINGKDTLESSDTLNITKVNKSSKYSCTASNKYGHVTLDISVHVSEVTKTALTPQACRITLMPPEVVVKFGDPVAINCSTSVTTTFKMGWEYSAGKATVSYSHAHWKIDKLEDWTLKPICYVNPDIGSLCQETASIILYKTPDLVSVSALDDGPMEEGSAYRLKCDIYNVAPVHNLRVKWYRGNTTLYTDNIKTHDVTPRNISSTLTITPLRSDHESLFRCETELHLGPRGPELPPTAASAPFVATVLYAPEFKEGNISKELIPDRDLTLNCSAEGNPDPEIKWIYKSAHNLKETTEGRQKIITVTGATSTNAGFYICVATNKVGNVTRTVTLVMGGKSSYFFVYWLLILLLVIILLVGLYYVCYRKKKKGEYSFVSNSDQSSFPMTDSAAGKPK